MFRRNGLKKGPLGWEKTIPLGVRQKKNLLRHVTTRVPRLPREKKMVCEKWWLTKKTDIYMVRDTIVCERDGG